MKSWVIRRKGQRNDFWRTTGDIGWAARDEATIFTDADKAYVESVVKLPKDGYWSAVKEK